MGIDDKRRNGKCLKGEKFICKKKKKKEYEQDKHFQIFKR